MYPDKTSMDQDTLEDVAREATQRWSITPREHDVLLGLLAGQDNQDLADRMGCARRTVEAHITNLLQKTRTQSRLALVSTCWVHWVKRARGP